MTRSTSIFALLTLACAGGGCAHHAASGTHDATGAPRAAAVVSPPAAAQATRPQPALPSASFRAPEPWKPTFGSGGPVQPPDADKEIWRAFVNQAEPMQKETPLWQPVPAKEVVTLAMPEDSHFRCFVNPLEILPQPDDYGTKLQAWLLKRELVCSSDDFATWTSYPHRVLLTADGKREVTLEAEALLRERGSDGSRRALYVLFRSDQENRKASTGAARVLPGVQVDD